MKFLQEKPNKKYTVYTPFGWKSFWGIGKTVLFRKFKIEFTDGSIFEAADDHFILTNSGFSALKNLKTGDVIPSRLKDKVVKSVIDTHEYENMYDLIDVSGSIYYTDDLISHNSTTISCFVLHYAIFNKDKTIGIVSNKLSSAKDILKRIKIMYEECPEYLKPGVVTYSKTEIEFENGSSIITSATSEDALRGRSINILVCLDKQEIITVLNKKTGDIKSVSLDDLFQELKLNS